VSEDDPGLWPVLLSQTVGDMLADPALPAAMFSAVASLTVAIAQDPWLPGSSGLEDDPDWREVLIPHGYGIAEYRINPAGHNVILTRIVPF
jgi:hypothetical protein